MYKRERVLSVVHGGDLPVVRDKLSLAFPTELFLPTVRRETLQTKDPPPFCLPATDHQYSLLLFTPTRQHTAPPILQEGPNTDMLHVTRLVTRLSELQMSFDGERKQPNTQEFSSLLFHSSLHSKLSFLFTVIDVVIVVVVLFFCFVLFFFSPRLQNQIRKSGHWMDS